MKLSKKWKFVVFALTLVVSLGMVVGCGGGDKITEEPGEKLTGNIGIDGSSTVFPITEAVAEEFQKLNQDVKVTVGVSGTGGGFKKFLVKEVDINNASRPIKEEEIKQAEENGIEYEEVTVAYDGLSIVVNTENDWVDHLTVEELNKIWNRDSQVKTWKDVRSEWPNEEIKLYGPGADSGTFDYFTEEVNGESGNIRADYTASEDDNVLVTGIAGDKSSIGFFGYAYYIENKDRLKIVPIDSGDGPVEPTAETIETGKYSPLSRPLLIYLNKEALNRTEVREFMKFYLTDGKEVIPDIGYVKLPEEKYDEILSKLELK